MAAILDAVLQADQIAQGYDIRLRLLQIVPAKWRFQGLHALESIALNSCEEIRQLFVGVGALHLFIPFHHLHQKGLIDGCVLLADGNAFQLQQIFTSFDWRQERFVGFVDQRAPIARQRLHIFMSERRKAWNLPSLLADNLNSLITELVRVQEALQLPEPLGQIGVVQVKLLFKAEQFEKVLKREIGWESTTRRNPQWPLTTFDGIFSKFPHFEHSNSMAWPWFTGVAHLKQMPFVSL